MTGVSVYPIAYRPRIHYTLNIIRPAFESERLAIDEAHASLNLTETGVVFKFKLFLYVGDSIDILHTTDNDDDSNFFVDCINII